ncbi:hypothetical protein M5K25_017843 [Dendrobium thyrsiflorum]|uniref:CCHC-type domain-containing protein n=1 Tax=Dendrobium thyrsiflorum TaxID=117978 RepID=A0ABD0UNN0_DENTH
MAAGCRRPSSSSFEEVPAAVRSDSRNLSIQDRLNVAVQMDDRDEEAIRRRKSKGELVISEGKGIPLKEVSHVDGKGKGIALIADCKTPDLLNTSGIYPAKTLDPEASSSGMNIFVNRFGNPNAIPVFDSKINADSVSPVHKSIPVKTTSGPVETLDGSNVCKASLVFEGMSKNNVESENLGNPWKKNPYIKLNFNKDKVVFSEDGKTVKLDESSEVLNAKRLEFSLVTKVFSKELPSHVVAWELRRQWARFGQFHFTTLGEGWYLCSFKSLEALEGVLSGGPWFVNYHINNVALIASMIGVPLMLDGNMFHWGRREFARVCVRVELDKPLPLGVWVEGMAGRFFQKVEYERILAFCYDCGMLGHDRASCIKNNGMVKNMVDGAVGQGAIDQTKHGHLLEVHESYGPWILVNHRRDKRLKFARPGQGFRAVPTVKIVIQSIMVNEDKDMAGDKGGKEILGDIMLSEEGEIIVDDRHGIEGTAELLSYPNHNGGSLDGKCDITVVNTSTINQINVANKFESLGVHEDENTSLEAAVEHSVEVVGCDGKNDIVEDRSLVVIGGSNDKFVKKKVGGSIEGTKIKLSKELRGLVPVKSMPRAKLMEGNDKLVFQNMIGMDWDFFLFPSVGQLGGILVMWRSDLATFSILKATEQCVIGDLEVFNNETWMISTVYGSKEVVKRRDMWECLHKVAVERHIARVASDHCPVILKIFDSCIKVKKNLKFEDVWVSFHASSGIISRVWRKSYVGDEMQILNKKCKRTLKELFFWSKAKLKDLLTLKETLKKEVLLLQEEEAMGGGLNEDKLLLLRKKVGELNVHLARLNTWWRQRAKVKWLVDGDSNSKFFHAYANARRNSNWISRVKGTDGVMVEDPKGVEESIKVVKKKIEDYYSWTGQKINFLKSSILMGKNIGKKKKRHISKILNIKVVEEMDYLGVKLALRRLSKADFQIFLDKAFKKLNVWGNHFISMAGRITLCKSVLLSIPLFVSSHSLVPLGILKEFDKACRMYIWNKFDGSHGLHFVAWETLCKPKVYGGWGLFLAVSRVGPLRARLAWNLLENPDSLLNRNLVAKYGKYWWKNNGVKSSSATWKIVMDGWNSLRGILRWSIASGSLVDIRKDVWILDRELDRWPTFVTNWEDEPSSLNSLIVNHAGDVPKLSQFFGEELVNLISKVEILQSLDEDRLELKSKLSGKSIPGLCMAAWYEDRMQEEVDRWFLKLKLNPRVELFVWRVCLNAIPTNDYLFRRGLVDSNLCPRGCLEVENIDHCTATCPKLVQVIRLLNTWGFSVPVFISFTNCCRKLKLISVRNSFLAKMYLVLIFHSWLSRNIVKHGGGVDSHVVIASKVVSFMATLHVDKVIWGNWGTNQPPRLSNFWHPPPPKWLKINIDESLRRSYTAGVGGVVRDYKGRFLMAFGCSYVHWDCAQMELLAFKSLKRFLQDWIGEANGIIIEGDNLIVINFLHKLYSIQGKKMIEQIKEDLLFLKLKDGNGVRLYPMSLFTINCTGDVCKGDVVMFKQRVYDKFNKVSRNGKVIGKRTIAGRVVKESYGSAKQQHTFTIEVLWSKGIKPLPSLYPLLVKGRNLYRYRTFRQVKERSRTATEEPKERSTGRKVPSQQSSSRCCLQSICRNFRINRKERRRRRRSQLATEGPTKRAKGRRLLLQQASSSRCFRSNAVTSDPIGRKVVGEAKASSHRGAINREKVTLAAGELRSLLPIRQVGNVEGGAKSNSRKESKEFANGREKKARPLASSRWANEADRSKVLEEKHRRGATARHVRASTKARVTAGSKRQRSLTDSKQHQIKRQKKPSEASTSGKKQPKSDNDKAHVKYSSNNKLRASSSSAKHSKKFKTKTSSYTTIREVNQYAQRPSSQNIFDNSHPDLHQRNRIAAPQVSRERFLIPVFNNNHNAGHIREPYSVYASQFDHRGHLSHHYWTSISPYDSRSSGHFFTPDFYDQRYAASSQFQGSNRPWPL